jgi:hypothetical protein
MKAPGKNLESKQKIRKPRFASVLGFCGGSSVGTQAADISFLALPLSYASLNIAGGSGFNPMCLYTDQ